jgi:hypothetical protein
MFGIGVRFVCVRSSTPQEIDDAVVNVNVLILRLHHHETMVVQLERALVNINCVVNTSQYSFYQSVNTDERARSADTGAVYDNRANIKMRSDPILQPQLRAVTQHRSRICLRTC